jgi:hypothetical protein
LGTKKGGKQAGSTTLTVSSDGNTLNGQFKDYTGAQVATGSFSESRRAPGPVGSNGDSGWRTRRRER